VEEKERLRKEFAVLCFDVFENTPQGKKLMERFKDILMGPIMGPDDSEAHGRTLEGRNMFIREIISHVETHKTIMNGE
jgi:hypothetical protein